MAALPSGLPETVDQSEALARFLMSSGHFNTTGVKAAAFMPHRVDLTTSVFCHGREPAAALWQVAFDHVVGGRTLHGAALVQAGAVRETGLDVEPNEPPPRQADLTGWSSAGPDPDMNVARWKLLALQLAERAELVRYP